MAIDLAPTPFQIFLMVLLAATWTVSAIHPKNRVHWLFDNILVFFIVPSAYVVGHRVGLSDFSFLLLTLYTVLHLIGAHFLYMETPVGWAIGRIFGGTRNSYDRLVHTSFGLLTTYPFFEFYSRIFSDFHVGWWYLFSFMAVMAIAGIYEIGEWIGARLTGENPEEFLQLQGDMWDTQKDMAVAGIGSLAVLSLLFFFQVLL